MDNSDPLVPFGIAVIIVVGLFIAIPFVRRTAYLLTAWNVLLVGVIVFAGVTSLEVKYSPAVFWQPLAWFQPTAKEVTWYMQATAAFIATLLAAYYFNSPARSFAQKRLSKWPEVTVPVTFFIFGCCLVIILSSIVFSRNTFLGPVTFNLAQLAAPAVSVFAFRLWDRNRRNLGWMTVFVGAFVGAAIFAILMSGGRRLLLSVAIGPIMYLYWTRVRFWGRSRTLLAIGGAAAVLISVSILYARFRYFSIATEERRTVGGIAQQIRKIHSQGNWFEVFTQGRLQYFGQSTGYCALLTQRFISQGAVKPIPLNTLRFLVSYPIPRKVWPGKPTTAGVTITNDAAHAPGNWGLGVAGQGAYEGGIPAIMLYAVLLAVGVRYLDEPLQLQPNNPFLITIHASALPHIAAIPRGDMGYMTMQVGQCVLFCILLGTACRMIFGTQRDRPIRAAIRDARNMASQGV